MPQTVLLIHDDGAKATLVKDALVNSSEGFFTIEWVEDHLDSYFLPKALRNMLARRLRCAILYAPQADVADSSPFSLDCGSNSRELVVGYQAKWRCSMSYLGTGLEHRWGERVRVNIPVRVEAAALSGANGCMTNLSLSGALMKSDCDLRLHTLIEVSVALPAPSTRTAVIKAHVSRKFKEGVGIEWYEFAPNIIRDLLRSALRSPP